MLSLLTKMLDAKSERKIARRPKPVANRKLSLEALEERQLLSGPGTCHVYLEAGTIHIDGSPSDDTATVSNTTDKVNVSLKCGSTTVPTARFNRNDVGSILFEGGNGND